MYETILEVLFSVLTGAVLGILMSLIGYLGLLIYTNKRTILIPSVSRYILICAFIFFILFFIIIDKSVFLHTSVFLLVPYILLIIIGVSDQENKILNYLQERFLELFLIFTLFSFITLLHIFITHHVFDLAQDYVLDAGLDNPDFVFYYLVYSTVNLPIYMLILIYTIADTYLLLKILDQKYSIYIKKKNIEKLTLNKERIKYKKLKLICILSSISFLVSIYDSLLIQNLLFSWLYFSLDNYSNLASGNIVEITRNINVFFILSMIGYTICFRIAIQNLSLNIIHSENYMKIIALISLFILTCTSIYLIKEPVFLPPESLKITTIYCRSPNSTSTGTFAELFRNTELLKECWGKIYP